MAVDSALASLPIRSLTQALMLAASAAMIVLSYLTTRVTAEFQRLQQLLVKYSAETIHPQFSSGQFECCEHLPCDDSCLSVDVVSHSETTARLHSG